MQNHSSKSRAEKFYVFSTEFFLFKVGLRWLTAVVFLSAGYCFAAQPVSVDVPKPAAYSAEAAAKAVSAESIVVETACQMVYQGRFDAAGELIRQFSQDMEGQSDPNRQQVLAELAQITKRYGRISQQRQRTREAAYKEQMAELEKFRATADVNDGNDVNNISAELLAIAKACEFADKAQKSQLLSESFVRQVLQRAKAKADEFESKGEWLDSYMNYYSWLQVIEEDDRKYSDYAEQLLDKANIVASLQSSPCETGKERFQAVEKEMFIRAIDALNSNYVNIVDYRQMAIKAIERCKLLAEVIKRSFSQDSQRKGVEGFVLPPDDKKLADWLSALAELLEQVNRSPTGMSEDKFIDVFEKVLLLNTTTIELPQPVLVAQFAEASLSALDPYTVMVWPRQSEDFEKIMTNEFTGIGIEISREKGLLTVVSLLPDTPAYNSGLDAQDVIEAVDGTPTKDMSLACAVKRITGPAGTKVTLTVKRTTEEQAHNITISRARITVPTVCGWQRTEAGKWQYMIDDINKIGYVRITNFSEKTADDLEKVLDQLESEGLKGLVLDFRFNTGGLLNSAVDVTDKFVDKGPIVITRPRSWVSSTYAGAHKENTHPNYPLAVLINFGSASASEIVAGALQDPKHNRATLVGDRTHGKGSVQGITTYPGDGAQLKYTMAYYHLPSGQRVESQEAMKKLGREDWGVRPDIEIKLRSDELKKMIDVQRDNSVLVKAGHDNGSMPLKKHTVEQTLESDPQLSVGLLVIRTKLAQANELVASSEPVSQEMVEMALPLLSKTAEGLD